MGNITGKGDESVDEEIFIEGKIDSDNERSSKVVNEERTKEKSTKKIEREKIIFKDLGGSFVKENHSRNNIIELYVKTLTGKIYTLDFYSIRFYDDVKYQIFELEGIPEDQQRIIYGGSLKGDAMYRNCDTRSTLQLVYAFREEEEEEVEVEDGKGTKIFSEYEEPGLKIFPYVEYHQDLVDYEERLFNPKKEMIIEIDPNQFKSSQLVIYEIKNGYTHRKNVYRKLAFRDFLFERIVPETPKIISIIPENGWKKNTVYMCTLGGRYYCPVRWIFKTGSHLVDEKKDLEDRLKYLGDIWTCQHHDFSVNFKESGKCFKIFKYFLLL